MKRSKGVIPGGGFEIKVDLNHKATRVGTGMAANKLNAIRRSIPHTNNHNLRSNLLQLADACPFHLANPKDCPLFALRKMEPRKRVQWLKALSKRDLTYLTTYHRACLAVKVKCRLARLRARTVAKKGRKARGETVVQRAARGPVR
jgi:hypothetical protein